MHAYGPISSYPISDIFGLNGDPVVDARPFRRRCSNVSVTEPVPEYIW